MRLDYVHKFRGLAILLIVAVHCVEVFDWSAQPGLKLIVENLLGDATVLFVFIAGFLFQHLSARFRYRDYLKRKVRNVLLPYLMMGAPAVVYVVATMPDAPYYDPGFFREPVPWQVAWLYLTGRMLTPYWFMPMIMIIFALAPLFIAIDRSPRFYWIIVPLTVIAMMIHRPPDNIGPIQAFVYFLPVYLAGMAASRHRDTMFAIVRRWGRLLWGAVAALTVAKAVWTDADGIVHASFSEIGQVPPDLLLPQKLLLAPLLLDLLRRYGRRERTMLDHLADISFGLFFVHFYVVMVFEKLMAEHRLVPEATLWSYVAYVGAVTLVSVGLITVVRTLAGTRSRVLIGS